MITVGRTLEMSLLGARVNCMVGLIDWRTVLANSWSCVLYAVRTASEWL